MMEGLSMKESKLTAVDVAIRPDFQVSSTLTAKWQGSQVDQQDMAALGRMQQLRVGPYLPFLSSGTAVC